MGTMTTPSVYSPRPIRDYRIKEIDDCQVSWILRQPMSASIWNLFYLSTPTIDSIPGSGKNWWKGYRPVVESTAAIVTDLLDDEVLFRKLMMSPHRFLGWFERTDHSQTRCFRVLGGHDWVQTVIERTRACIDNKTFDSNVIAVDFGRKAA